MNLREFRRRTLHWEGSVELTLGVDGKIYDVVEFTGYREPGGIRSSRNTICFIPDISGFHESD